MPDHESQPQEARAREDGGGNYDVRGQPAGGRERLVRDCAPHDPVPSAPVSPLRCALLRGALGKRTARPRGVLRRGRPVSVFSVLILLSTRGSRVVGFVVRTYPLRIRDGLGPFIMKTALNHYYIFFYTNMTGRNIKRKASRQKPCV
jgi:hypothetical protein